MGGGSWLARTVRFCVHEKRTVLGGLWPSASPRAPHGRTVVRVGTPRIDPRFVRQRPRLTGCSSLVLCAVAGRVADRRFVVRGAA